ncbi:MAG: PIN domain-containing protein [Candidatus Vecturithrix sp.]|jgi:predicted nucleic acid-binding protein|nr:PIN domain-containing protein [Candidatus Vecturithrix sp.]
MYALDTNILVYAHNIKSPYHASAKLFVEQVMNARNADGQLSVCFPAQILMEFLNVITWQRLEAPLPLPDAIQVVQDYRATGVTILYPQQTQLETLVDLLKSVTTRKKIFDVALVATLKDYGIPGLYTVNTKDFKEFTFLDAKNPL